MIKFVLPALAIAGVMLSLDIVWLGGIAAALYQRGIGHLMAAQPQLAPAALFYLLYGCGALLFVVQPRARGDLRGAAAWGALFGFMTYMTYDLTNLATLRDWPLVLSVVDTAWGCVATATACTVGKLVADRCA